MINTQNDLRPPRDSAEESIAAFLKEKIGENPGFVMIEDGNCGWAFWINSTDTTSYVHPDLCIEWYGTSWEKGSRVKP